MNTHLHSLANARRNLALLSLLAAPCAAQQIIQPVTVSTTLSGTNSTQELLIDLSGLSPAYVSGVTDFTTFVSQTEHTNAGDNLTRPFAPGRTITFGLGMARPIDAIGLWGQGDTAFQLTQFTLFADNDSDLDNGATPLGTFNQALTRDGSEFSFPETTAVFVHILLIANGGGNQIRMGEVAFRSRPLAGLLPAPTLPTTRIDFDDLPPGQTNVVAISAAGRSGDANITTILPAPLFGGGTGSYNSNVQFGQGLARSGFTPTVIGNGGSAQFQVMTSLTLGFGQPITQFGFRVADTFGAMRLEFFEGNTATTTQITPPFTSASGLTFVDYSSPNGSEGFDRVRISRNGPGDWLITELEAQIPFDEIGVGCVGSGGELSLTPQTAPLLGTSYALQLSNAAPQAPLGIAVMLLNLSQLPGSGLDLTPLGAPSCRLRIEGAITTAFQTAGGSGTFSFAVPSNPSLVGADLFTQAVDLDAAANALGITVSNALGFEIR